MKKLHYFFALLITSILFSCSQNEVSIKNLVERDQIVYEVNSETPFSGIMVEHYQNNQIKKKGTFKNGLRQGVWKYFKENGRQQYEVNFKDNKWHGLTIEYKDSIDIHKNYKMGILDGSHKTYENGILKIDQNYKDDKLSGSYKKYDDNQTLIIEGEYLEGLKDGIWIEYLNGNVQTKVGYKNNNHDGIYELYSLEGALKTTGKYANGSRDGLWTEYYENSKKKEEFNYTNGKRKGTQKKWDKTGNLTFEGSIPGLCTWFDLNGNKTAQAIFISDLSIDTQSLKVWSRQGKATSPYNILINGVWKGEWSSANGKESRFEIMYKPNGEYFKMAQYPRDNYGRAMMGVANEGTWSFDISRLPKLYITINPEVRCTKCKYENPAITKISSTSLTLENKEYKNATAFGVE